MKSVGMWDMLEQIKKPFLEPNDAKTSLKEVLDGYVAAAMSQKGAILLCVFNGKVSEGFDFSGKLVFD